MRSDQLDELAAEVLFYVRLVPVTAVLGHLALGAIAQPTRRHLCKRTQVEGPEPVGQVGPVHTQLVGTAHQAVPAEIADVQGSGLNG